MQIEAFTLLRLSEQFGPFKITNLKILRSNRNTGLNIIQYLTLSYLPPNRPRNKCTSVVSYNYVIFSNGFESFNLGIIVKK